MSQPKRPGMDEDSIRELLQQVGARPTPPADAEARIKENVAAAWREEIQRRKQRSWTRYALAASVVMGLAVTSLVLPTRQEVAPIAEVAYLVGNAQYLDEDGSWQLLAQGTTLGAQTIKTGADSYLALATPDGLSLRLADNSQVTLTGSGLVDLTAGALYADTGGLSDNELKVTTRFGEARDIGTRFEVRVADDTWRVQVRDGVVEVADDGIREITRAGDRITISQNNLMQHDTVSEHDASWQWAGIAAVPFQIEGASLRDYLDWVAHETGTRLNFSTASVEAQAKSTILHGSINGLSPSESLAVVLATTDFKAGQADASILLIER